MGLGLGFRVRVRARLNPAQLDRGAQQRARHLGVRGVRPAEDERAGVHLVRGRARARAEARVRLGVGLG